jgi:predicted metal-dependent phosphoesterase TrpH
MAMRKGIFHIHTSYSFDCLVSPESIVRTAALQGVDYLVISDHDSIEGAMKGREYAKRYGLSIDIPLAAEYLTDVGDIVAVGLSEDLKHLRDHKKLCHAVHDEGGYTVLPHPYEGHDLKNMDFHLIDGIEIFNSRSSVKNNEKALTLALELNKPYIMASDAHFLSDVANSIFYFDGPLPLKGSIYPLKQAYTPPYRKNLSQFVKGYKKKDIRLMFRSIKTFLKLN